MLKITINDQQVDLEGVKFSLQLNSPIPFNPEDNQQEGSFAFGVTFPATAANKKIFGFPHRLEQYPDPQKDFPGLMYFAGRLLFKIVISLTDSSDFSYRGNVKVDLGYYTSMIGEKTLRDLEYEGVQTIGTTTQDVVDHAQAVVAQDYPDVNYNFPETFNDLFYGEEHKMNESWTDFVNHYVHGSMGFRPNSIDNDREVHNYYNLCPFPYLFYVLKHCYSEFGFNPIGPVFKDQNLARLLIYNNYALDLIEDHYKSTAELSDDQDISGLNSQILFDYLLENIDDCWDSELMKYQITKTGDHQISAHLSIVGINDTGNPNAVIDYTIFAVIGAEIIPVATGSMQDPYSAEVDVNFIQFIESDLLGQYIYLLIEFNYSFNGDPLSGTVLAESWFSVRNVTWSNLNMYAKTINIANHVPDIKIRSFLVTLMRTFGIIHHFDNGSRNVELLFLKDILASADEELYDEVTVKSTKLAAFRQDKSYKLSFSWASSDESTKDNFQPWDPNKLIGTYLTVADLPALAADGDQAIILNINSVYRWQDDAWTWFTDLFYPYEIGDAVTSISLECTPMLMYDSRVNEYVPRVCPKIRQEGSSINLGVKEFGFHLISWYGLQDDATGHEYPYASSTKYGPTGAILGVYDLKLDGSSGIFENFLQQYYEFVMNRSRPVDYDKYFTASQIQAINFIRKKRMFRHVFLLDEVSIPISNSSIGMATMKLQKI